MATIGVLCHRARNSTSFAACSMAAFACFTISGVSSSITAKTPGKLFELSKTGTVIGSPVAVLLRVPVGPCRDIACSSAPIRFMCSRFNQQIAMSLSVFCVICGPSQNRSPKATLGLQIATRLRKMRNASCVILTGECFGESLHLRRRRWQWRILQSDPRAS